MAHLGSSWTIRANKAMKPDELVLLGDIDGSGTKMIDVIRPALRSLCLRDKQDESRVVCKFQRFVDCPGESELAVVLHTHEYDVRSTLRTDDGVIERVPKDAEIVEAMAFFDLPKGGDFGKMSLHIPHRRSAREAIDKAIRTHLRENFGLTLQMDPVAHRQTVEAALAEDRVRQVRLVAYEKPTERFKSSEVFGRGDVIGRVETTITPRRGFRLWGGKALKALNSDKDFNELITFEGIQYDRAAVTVDMPNNRTRTIRIDSEAQRLSHALTFDLDVGNEPTDDALLSELRQITP